MMGNTFRSLAAIALACVAACSGDGDSDDLTGRWEAESGPIQSLLEFFPDGRFAEYMGSDPGSTDRGTYTARDGTLTLVFDEELDDNDLMISWRVTTSFWTDGDVLHVSFASPDHDGDGVVGTWREKSTREIKRSDGTKETEVYEVVTTFDADGTVTQELFFDGRSDNAYAGTYMVSSGAIVFEWLEEPGPLTLPLVDRRLGGSTYVRVTAD